MRVWKDAAGKTELISWKVTEKEGLTEIHGRYRLPVENSTLGLTYKISGNGSLQTEMTINKGKETPPLPSLGMQFAVADDFTEAAFYGKGPHESYWDRKEGARLGLYHIPVNDLSYLYVRPQENGNHSDVRWLQLQGKKGQLTVIGIFSFDFSVWSWSPENLEKATHINELETRDAYTVNIDYKQMGLGGDDSWSEKSTAHPKYRLSDDTYHFSFILDFLK